MSNLISCEQTNSAIFEIQNEDQLLKFFQKYHNQEKVILSFSCKKCGENFKRKGRAGYLKSEFKKRKESYFLCRNCSRKTFLESLPEEEKIERKKKRSEISKTFWKEMDFEKRKILAERRNKAFKNWCENLSEEEKQLYSQHQSDGQKRRFSNPEEIEKSRKNSEKMWENFSSEKKQALKNSLKEAANNYRESLSEDEKEKRSETLKKAYSNLTEEQKVERSRKISEKRKTYFQRTPKEELEKAVEKRKQTMQNKSPEEKASIQEKCRKAFFEKSKEELEEINRKRSLTMLNKTKEEKQKSKEEFLNWWNSLTEEERKNRSKRISEKIKKRISERTDEQKLKIRKKASSHLGKYKAAIGEVFDSSWELKFFEYHKSKGNEIKREPIALHFEFEGVNHTFIPDFEVNGQLIEIKGDQFFDENGKMINPFDHSQDDLFEAKHQCGLQNGVLFLKGNDLKNMRIL